MQTHEPECHWSKPCEPLHGGPPLDEHYAGTIGGAATYTPYCSNCAVWCICDLARAAYTRGWDDALYRAAWSPLRDVPVFGFTTNHLMVVEARLVRAAILGLRTRPIDADDTRRNVEAVLDDPA